MFTKQFLVSFCLSHKGAVETKVGEEMAQKGNAKMPSSSMY